MKRDIAVVGGGLAGYCAAIGFAASGFDTVLLAPKAPADRRSTALIGRSVAFLKDAGVWPRIEAVAQPLVVMRIIDDTQRLFRATNVEFRAAEIDLPSFGVNVLNAQAQDALAARAAELSARLTVIERPLDSLHVEGDTGFLTLDDGSEVQASLVVGADGRGSRVRESAGIALRRWSYPQSAIVLNFKHERDHGATSTEFHRRSGPFTQVPLPGKRSSLVWVEEPETAELIVDLKPERLARMVEERLHSILGAVEIEEGLQVFPLSGAAARGMTSPRVALVGEAAHVFPPIGAQGLNLGLRDAAAIVEAAKDSRDDPGSLATLARYEARRSVDVASRTLAVDLLNRSLLAGLLPVQLGRSIGLGALSGVPLLRRFAMREGVSPGAGLRAIASAVAPKRSAELPPRGHDRRL